MIFYVFVYCLDTISIAAAFKCTLPALACPLKTWIAAIAGGWGDLGSVMILFVCIIITKSSFDVPYPECSRALPRPNALETDRGYQEA